MTEIYANHYAIYDAATGEVLRYQTCPEGELEYNLREGEAGLAIDSIPFEGRHGVQDGCLVQLPDLPDQRPYTARRREDYPPIGDQLDAIWKAFGQMAPGDVPEPAREMLAKVQAVKAKHPPPPA